MNTRLRGLVNAIVSEALGKKGAVVSFVGYDGVDLRRRLQPVRAASVTRVGAGQPRREALVECGGERDPACTARTISARSMHVKK